MPLVDLKNCAFRYPNGTKEVLSGIDLSIHRGDRIRITGRNGSGKSTLVKIVSGILQPTSGSITFDNEAEPVYMDQNAGEMLDAGLTVAEHILAFSVSNPHSESGLVAAAFESFRIGLEDRMDDFVGHLSGGQRQVTALLSVLYHGANVLCLDEFVSALDSKSSSMAVELIARAVETTGVAVLAISHVDIEFSFDRDYCLE